MPSILFINRVFPPQRGATGERLADMVKTLEKQGWDVRVLSVDIYLKFRLATYVICYFTLLFRALKLPRHDVTVVMTDPPMLALIGLLIKRIKKTRLIHWSQDVYPDLLRALGGLPGRCVAAVLSPLMTAALNRYDMIVPIGTCMAERLQKNGVRAPMRILRNNADPAIQPLAHSTLRQRLGLQERFVVVYAGTVGLAHRFDALLDAAKTMAHSDPDVIFMISGTGNAYATVRTQVQEHGLTNVVFQPWVPAEELSDLLAAADAHVVTMAPQVLGMVVPSKAAGVLAAGHPCIFIGPAECDVAHLIASEGGGDVIDPPSPESLVAVIRRYKNDTAHREATCGRALNLARKFYAQDRVITDLLPS